jgi:hypothetical protein
MSGWVAASTAVLLLLLRASHAQSDLFQPQFIQQSQQQQQQQQPSEASDAADSGAKAGQPATDFAVSNITKQETALTSLTDSRDPVKAAAAVRHRRSPPACETRQQQKPLDHAASSCAVSTRAASTASGG